MRVRKRNGRSLTAAWIHGSLIIVLLVMQLAAWFGLNPAERSHLHRHVYSDKIVLNHHETILHFHHHHHHPRPHEPCPDQVVPSVTVLPDLTAVGMGLTFLLPTSTTILPTFHLFSVEPQWQTAVELIFLSPPDNPPRSL